MKTYINKKDKRIVFVVPLGATTQDGYIVMNDGVIGWESKESFDKLYEEESNYSETIIDKGLSKILNSLFMANKNIDDKNNMTYKTPTDEEIKLSEKELKEDLKKHDKNVGFYWPDSMSNEEIEKQLGVIRNNKPYIIKMPPIYRHLSDNKITSTNTQVLYKNALTYYNKNCKGNFEAAVTPLLIYLAKEHHPMTKVIVENDKAELVEGIKSIVNNSFFVG